MTTFDDILYSEAREPQPQVRPFEQGRILSVSGGECRVTLDSFPSHVAFGPAPYGLWTDNSALSGPELHDHVLVGPQPGDKCLVAFAGHGTGHPWVVAWQR